MPFWFIQKTARSKYELHRKYLRTKRRAARELARLYAGISRALGLTDDKPPKRTHEDVK